MCMDSLFLLFWGLRASDFFIFFVFLACLIFVYMCMTLVAM